ncbi:MAG: hypothetical protein RBS73_18170 [Prolixibacteraceae bacterium]|jgi:hypothetical protein|nr:hypothetical protein [Prolixibacteraceae bacterium]
MQKTNILILLAAIVWAFVSCGKENDPVPDLPEWEKNNTVSIQFYSRLSNEKLFKTDDYSAVISRIHANQNQVAVLHRVDAVYNSTEILNPMVPIAAETVKIPVFAWNRYSGTRVEGSGILIGHTIAEMKNTPVSEGCNHFTVPVTMVTATGSINMTFTSISFENENQLTTGAATIKEKLDDKTVLAGVAAKTLQNKLKTAFPEGNYRVEIIESTDGKANQIIFVITGPKWIVREHKEVAVGTDGISCYDIKIEKL